jgi:hypothetical protein
MRLSVSAALVYESAFVSSIVVCLAIVDTSDTHCSYHLGPRRSSSSCVTTSIPFWVRRVATWWTSVCKLISIFIQTVVLSKISHSLHL